MKLSEQIKPISYLKAHAAELIRTLGENGESIVITQNGEAKAVLQDIRSWEQNQETMALLKILAIGNQEIAAGKVIPLEQSLQSIREKRRK
ncbi:MAG: type II toxin-antitoxin system Phd/YefM family antitoxin [Bacteroidetes bacterium]|nr:type II toxin-antitoxin system Phd/YefM family antitoxin [Bacteroidota bacterium]